MICHVHFSWGVGMTLLILHNRSLVSITSILVSYWLRLAHSQGRTLKGSTCSVRLLWTDVHTLMHTFYSPIRSTNMRVPAAKLRGPWQHLVFFESYLVAAQSSTTFSGLYVGRLYINFNTVVLNTGSIWTVQVNSAIRLENIYESFHILNWSSESFLSRNKQWIYNPHTTTHSCLGILRSMTNSCTPHLRTKRVF